MEKKEMLYEGKAKKVYTTEDPDVLIVSYKDDATAFNGLKKGTIVGKGAINNRMTNFILQEAGGRRGYLPTWSEELNDTGDSCEESGDCTSGGNHPQLLCGQLCPRKWAWRKASSSNARHRSGIQLQERRPGRPAYQQTTTRWLMGLCHPARRWTRSPQYAFKINDSPAERISTRLNIDLIDFKIRVRPLIDGKIILADEISPDTCRLWDKRLPMRSWTRTDSEETWAM